MTRLISISKSLSYPTFKIYDTRSTYNYQTVIIVFKNTVKQMKENMREQKYGGNIFQYAHNKELGTRTTQQLSSEK